ncbi:MAG: SPFH/Band 7/PHB domain protein, partial [Thermoplasmata archaeon]|nr:SPFH/Band 7/PHB domain protein [Thermoplasmata archaeon]
VARAKHAMQEQTSAELESRAAIRRADGEKKASILRAEGQKRSRILEAEGLRQSKILEAEGQRLATILESQGEAQKLRILSLGALPLDSKALTILSLDALKSLGDGQATKIIFPFELTKLIQGAANYLGTGAEIPEHTAVSSQDIERLVGKADDVLGKIPKHSELKAELDRVEEEMRVNAEDVAPPSISKRSSAKGK